VLQQWSGIQRAVQYAENIFKNAGFGVNTILLFIIHHRPRQHGLHVLAWARWTTGAAQLMLFGCAGIAVSHLLMGGLMRLE
jgi:hypothetical protein